MGNKLTRLLYKIPFFRPDPEDEDLKIISRAEWFARVPKWREDLIYPALSATTVYTGTEPCNSPEECTRAVQELQAKQMDEEGLPDIQYSFLVGGDGRVYEGRGWHTISNRTRLVKCMDSEFPPPPVVLNKDTLKFHPDRRIVIAYIGDENKSKATYLMESAARDLVNYGINYFYLYTGEDDQMTVDDFIKTAEGRKKKEERDEENRESGDSDDSDD